MTWIPGDVTSELSQRYNRDFSVKDPTAKPVSNVKLVLAVPVVMPDVAAVLLQLWDTRSRPRAWSRRQRLSCALVGLAGAAALVGISHLDRLEQAGHAGRASSVRVETRLPINRTEEEHKDRGALEYRGRIPKYTETLFLVARSGYRPAQTRRLLVGSAAAYAALAAAVIARAVVQACFLPACLLPAHSNTTQRTRISKSRAVSPTVNVGFSPSFRRRFPTGGRAPKRQQRDARFRRHRMMCTCDQHQPSTGVNRMVRDRAHSDGDVKKERHRWLN